MKTIYTYILIPLFVILFAFSSSAFAQELFPEEGIEEFLEPEEERMEPNDFGAPYRWSLDYIGAAKCVQLGTPAAWQFAGAGYIYRTGGPTDWWCPVQLPNGVRIWRVRCYYYDNSNTDEVAHWLQRYTGNNTTETFGVAGTGIGATPGFTSASFAPNPLHIVDNRFGYAIIIRQTTTNPDTALRGCRISYDRIQTAAGEQIFEDVPPSNNFYQAINNLYRSGITQGCRIQSGYTWYCPKTVVTREQMAAFLSRGFGLWQGYNSPDP